MGYAERNDGLREAFLEVLKKSQKENIIYGDETGMYENECLQKGWGLKGKRLHGLKKGNRGKRVNTIAFLKNNKIIAPIVFEGSCNRDIIITYFEEVLFPSLTNKHILILDNAAFHKGVAIDEIVKKHGHEILYLPPYSPDFNPIEKIWATLKNQAKKFLSNFSLFYSLSKSYETLIKPYCA